MKLSFSSPRSKKTGGVFAFTLIEVAVVVSIIAILVALFFPELSTARERAQKVVCISHLRSLHISFGAYLNDNESWPQCPDDREGQAADQFWVEALKDYVGDTAIWRCPTLMRQTGGAATSGTDTESPLIHYTPTQFDENPMSPRKWASQPWLIEIGDMHHCGTLMIRTDGCVQSFRDAVQAATAIGQ